MAPLRICGGHFRVGWEFSAGIHRQGDAIMTWMKDGLLHLYVEHLSAYSLVNEIGRRSCISRRAPAWSQLLRIAEIVFNQPGLWFQQSEMGIGERRDH